MSVESASRTSEVPYRVLLIEDNPIDAEVVQYRLGNSKDSRYFVTTVTSLEEALVLLTEQHPDVVLLDLSLPDAQGFEPITRIAEVKPSLPIVVLTGHEEGNLAVRALEAGSEDFLTKKNMDTESLERSIKYSIARKLVHDLQVRLHFSQQFGTRTIHSERLAALGELAAGVAHELNQPLNAIKLIAQSILRYDPDPEKFHGEVREILSLVQTMAETVDQMRLFSRSKEVVTTPLDVNELVTGTLKLVGQEIQDRGISMSTDLAPRLGRVDGHSVQLGQCLLNLILNARDALESCQRDDKAIEVVTFSSLSPEGEPSIVIEVRDNGPGVPERARQRIFEPFFTTKAPGSGTGLGLAIAAKVVGQHAGHIEEERTEGGRTVFRVILPESAPVSGPAN